MAKILNTVLSMLGIFLLGFMWMVYCTKDTLLSAALAAITALASGYLIFQAQSEWSAHRQDKKVKSKNIAALAELLRFGENNAALIGEMMRYYRFETEVLDYDNLIATKNGKRCYVALRYAADSVDKQTLVSAVVAAKRAGADKLYLFAHKADKSLLSWAGEEMDINFADVANVYSLLEQGDRLPPLPRKISHPITRFLPKFAFNRRRFGWYVMTSIFMLALTVVSFVKWYTLCWASVSLALGVYSLVNKRYNTPPTALTLD